VNLGPVAIASGIQSAVATGHAPAQDHATSVVALRYARVGHAYASGVTAIDAVTLDVPAGTRLGILGPNGGGKSTLLKLTLGLLRLQTGVIEVFGRSPIEARNEGLVGYVPQRIEAELAFPLSARQVVGMAVARRISPWKRLATRDRETIDQSLDVVGARDFADRPVGTLSGGQLQRVMIARALAIRPRLLLLDEPTVGIDVAGQQRFAELLRDLHQRLGLTIVVVSHDIRTIAAGCDRIACLSRTLHSHVGPEGLTPQVLAEVFRHDVAAIFGDIHVDAHSASQCDHPHHDAPVQLAIDVPRGTRTTPVRTSEGDARGTNP
jgi:zinc transport system ATP-binding protein